MVDRSMRELRIHGEKNFPVAAYDWYGPDGMAGDFVLECHWHEGWELFAIYEGCAQFSINGKKRLMREKDVVLIPGGSLHTAESVDGGICRYRSIVFAMPMLFGLIDDVVHKKYIQPLYDNPINAEIFVTGDTVSPSCGAAVWECFQKAFIAVGEHPESYELLAKAYLYELIAYLFPLINLSERTNAERRLRNSTQCVKQIIQYISENYQQQITITQLADRVNMSVGHFGKLFRQMTSYSPIDYLIILRLSKAADRLMSTNETILNIALDVGFNNIGYFIRAFSQKYGCTPRQYRRLTRCDYSEIV